MFAAPAAPQCDGGGPNNTRTNESPPVALEQTVAMGGLDQSGRRCETPPPVPSTPERGKDHCHTWTPTTLGLHGRAPCLEDSWSIPPGQVGLRVCFHPTQIPSGLDRGLPQGRPGVSVAFRPLNSINIFRLYHNPPRPSLGRMWADPSLWRSGLIRRRAVNPAPQYDHVFGCAVVGSNFPTWKDETPFPSNIRNAKRFTVAEVKGSLRSRFLPILTTQHCQVG